MRALVWPLAIACVVLCGCATAKTESQAPSVDVTGSWGGTFTWPYGVSPITLNLRQDGGNVTGDIVTTGTLGEVRQGNGPVEGTVSGDALSVTFPGGGANLSVRGNRMSGFSSSGSTWNLQRQ